MIDIPVRPKSTLGEPEYVKIERLVQVHVPPLCWCCTTILLRQVKWIDFRIPATAVAVSCTDL